LVGRCSSDKITHPYTSIVDVMHHSPVLIAAMIRYPALFDLMPLARAWWVKDMIATTITTIGITGIRSGVQARVQH